MEQTNSKLPPGVNVLAITPEYSVAIWDRVAVHKLFLREGPESLNARMKAHDLLYRNHPDNVLSLTVVKESCEIPDTDLRNEATKVMRVLAPRTKCIVVVIEGSGFWKSAARSVLTSMQLLVAREQRMRICESVDESCTLLAREAGESALWARQLKNVVEAL